MASAKWMTVGSYADASDAFVDRFMQLLRTNHTTVSDACVASHDGLFECQKWMQLYDIEKKYTDTHDANLNDFLMCMLQHGGFSEHQDSVRKSLQQAQMHARNNRFDDDNTLAQLLGLPFVLLYTLETFLNALYEFKPLLTCVDNVRTFEKNVEVMSVTCTTLLTLYVAEDHRSFCLPVLQQETPTRKHLEQVPALVCSSLRDVAIGVFLVNLRCHAATQNITDPNAQTEMTALAASVQKTRCMPCSNTIFFGINPELFAVLCFVPGADAEESAVQDLRLSVAAHAFGQQRNGHMIAFDAAGKRVFKIADFEETLYSSNDDLMPSYFTAMLECLCLASNGRKPIDRIGNFKRLFGSHDSQH